MALGFEFFADGLDATGVLRVDLPVALELAPVGVMRLRPCCANSSAAYAAIHEKIPVVIGQVKSVLCFFASAGRGSLMVVSLPLGTFFISASTSSGAGMTNLPSPNFLGNLLSPLSPYFGKSLES